MAQTPTSVRVTLNDKSGVWFNHEMNKIDAVLDSMAKAVINEADMRVPYKNGTLRDSHRIVKGHKAVAIIYGGGPIRYGDYQERGKRRDGTHVVRNYSTAGTGKEYLQTSGKNVTKRGIKWLLSHS